MDEEEKKLAAQSCFGGILVGIILFAIALIITGYTPADYKHLQQEAIKHGAAYWQVNDDGSTAFKWKEEIKP